MSHRASGSGEEPLYVMVQLFHISRTAFAEHMTKVFLCSASSVLITQCLHCRYIGYVPGDPTVPPLSATIPVPMPSLLGNRMLDLRELDMAALAAEAAAANPADPFEFCRIPVTPGKYFCCGLDVLFLSASIDEDFRSIFYLIHGLLGALGSLVMCRRPKSSTGMLYGPYAERVQQWVWNQERGPAETIQTAATPIAGLANCCGCGCCGCGARCPHSVVSAGI